tara:strand:- start:421 stop:645 length:225 start_codon:yes stop_codon:yes gene_type:complete
MKEVKYKRKKNKQQPPQQPPQINIDVPESTQEIMLKMIRKQNRLLIRQIARKNNWDYHELVRLVNKKGANKIII